MLEAPRAEKEEADGLTRLKSLLFRGEADRLAQLEDRVDEISCFVGDQPRLEIATASVLVEAVDRAELARHDDLARAVAPVMIASIRNEILNSREKMVEMLYPIAGQMIIAAVANTFREMMATINEKIEHATSIDRLKLRIRARLTGRPVSELLAAQSRRVQFLRILLLERGSGTLLAAWRADGQPEEHGEMIGGLIAALTGFARDALGDGEGDIRRLDFAGHNVYLHTSPTFVIASETSAPLSAAVLASLNHDCIHWLAQVAQTGDTSDAALAEFIQGALARWNEAVPRTAAKTGSLAQKLIFATAAALVIFFFGRGAFRTWREYQFNRAYEHAISVHPSLARFPIEMRIDHGENRVELRGTAASQSDVAAALSELRSINTGYQIAENIEQVVPADTFAASEARAAATLGELRDVLTTLRGEVATIGANVAQLSNRYAVLDGDTVKAEAMASTAQRIAELERSDVRLAERVDDLDRSGAKSEALAAASRRLNELERDGAPGDDLARARADQATLAQSTGDLTRKLAEIDVKLAELGATLQTPRARIAHAIEGFAIFFDRDKPIDQGDLGPRLDALAAALNSTELAIRVVGYTDPTGPGANPTVSRKRAQTVADLLVSRGVSHSKVIVVARAAAQPIAAASVDQRERNRRVEFEIAFDGETAP